MFNCKALNILSGTKLSLLLVFFVSCADHALSQVTITGPTCVNSGISYQYLINNQWDSGATMQICLQGAVTADLGQSCTANAAPLRYVLVVWNPGLSGGSLNLTSTAGNSTLAVTITTRLKAGTITASKMQSVGYDSLPVDIHCAPDTGGGCKPVYQHQWQQSFDNVHWTDMSLATAGDLLALPAQKQTIFYRRKTVDTDSGIIAYSDSAEVMVGPPPPGTVMPSIN
jgi:hypothetical protein